MEEKPGRDWQVLAWFIHDHLPYSEMVFFARNGTVNLTWRGDPDDESRDGYSRRGAGQKEKRPFRGVGPTVLSLAGCRHIHLQV